MGQRAFVAIVTVVLFILGAILGSPSAFPTVNGNVLTPEFIVGLIAPVILVVTTLRDLFRAITDKVTSQAVNPGDILALVRMREFWLYVLGAVVAVVHLFIKNDFLSPEQQAVIVDGILIIVNLLMNSYADRPSGQRALSASAMAARQVR